ncbi:MAG: hypothetical protein RIQ56_356 [Candidatus Parcubacteria bacterium]
MRNRGLAVNGRCRAIVSFRAEMPLNLRDTDHSILELCAPLFYSLFNYQRTRHASATALADGDAIFSGIRAIIYEDSHTHLVYGTPLCG